MKILLLNPHIDAEHAFLKELRSLAGWAVICPESAAEAKQLLGLHGDQLDLAVVHREGGGLDFLTHLKTHPRLKDLAVVVTSQEWGEADFARHQATEQGANAYLKWPSPARELVALARAIFGESGAPSAGASAPSMEIPSAVSDTGLILEEPSSLIERREPSDSPAISLDAPSQSVELSAPSVSAEPDAPPSDGISLTGISMSDPAESTPVNDGATAPGPALDLSSSEAALPLASDDPSVGLAGDLAAIEQPSALDMSVDLSAVLIPPPAADEVAPEAAAEDEHPQATRVMPRASRPGAAPIPRVPTPEPEGALEPDPEAEQEMPYLFRKGGATRPAPEPGIFYPQPLGDAVVPGGAAHAPDAETLKKYLMLREQDVSVLSSQLRAVRAQQAETDRALREERGRTADLTHAVAEHKRRVDEFEREKAALTASFQAEIDELKFQTKARIDKAKLLEAQVREAAEEMERLKDRVRVDIRKIRVREKELENRLEIMKKDSEALIGAREGKIVELKRKLDVLEFNMDLLQDQNSKEKEVSSKLRERLTKAAQVVRVAAALADDKEAS